MAKDRPYIVGEREPEMFMPDVNGRVYNMQQMRTLLNQASGQVSAPAATHAATPVATRVESRGLSDRDIQRLARALGKEVRDGSFEGTKAGSSEKAALLLAARRT